MPHSRPFLYSPALPTLNVGRGRDTRTGSCFVAKQLVPAEVWKTVDPLLPPGPPKPNGAGSGFTIEQLSPA